MNKVVVSVFYRKKTNNYFVFVENNDDIRLTKLIQGIIVIFMKRQTTRHPGVCCNRNTVVKGVKASFASSVLCLLWLITVRP